MQCPDCGGAMWDNRQTKKNPKQPDYKCKNKDGCGKGVWLDGKSNNAPPVSQNGNAHASRSRALGPLYNECLDFAKKAMTFHFGNDCATSDIVAATATLFIRAANSGEPIRAMKPAPAPSPPPPPPQRQPEPEEALPF